MGMQEQLNQQSEEAIKQSGKQLAKGIVASIRCTAFGAREFMDLCGMISKEGGDKLRHNNISVAKLVRMTEGRPGDSVSKIDASMTESATKSFKKYASQYGVKYSLVRDAATTPPTYSVFFAAKDTSIIDQCIKQYVKDKYQDRQKGKGERESIQKKMKRARKKMKDVNKNREKIKERSEKDR